MLRDRQQSREAVKIKTPLRLCFSAPLREQKKECLAKKGSREEITLCAFPSLRLCVKLFFHTLRDKEHLHQSTQPQGAGGVSMGLVRSNFTENSVADPSLLRL